MTKFIPKVNDYVKVIPTEIMPILVCHDEINEPREVVAILKDEAVAVLRMNEGLFCFSFEILHPSKTFAEIEHEKAVMEACRLVDSDNGYGFFRNYDNEKVMKLTVEALVRLGYSKQQVKPLNLAKFVAIRLESATVQFNYQQLLDGGFIIQGGDK